MALAIDHRIQLEAVAREVGAPFERISDFKVLAVQAAARVADGRPGFGMFIDGRYGREALFRAADHKLWVARPVELTGSRPLDFEYGGSLGTHLIEWPTAQVIKCLCFYHPDDPEELRLRQERELARAYDACRTLGRDLLIEIIAGKHGTLADDTIPRVMQRIYDIGIKPDWWKLEPQKSVTAWEAISETVLRNDSYCRGVMVLGLEAPFADLVESFRACAGVPVVKGFAVGRTIHIDPARAWLGGKISDAQAVDQMAERFASLVTAWTDGRRAKAA
jgi:5-dehydro-2-deoxygluconokinase